MGDVQENKSVIEEPVDSEKKEDAKKDIDVGLLIYVIK